MNAASLFILTSCSGLSWAAISPWWTESSAGWVGGIAGSAIVISGVLVGLCGRSGWCKRFMLWFMPAIIGLGLLALLAGIIAWASRQPYHIYYSLLQFGGLTTGIFSAIYPGVRNHYRQMELRKMQANDIS